MALGTGLGLAAFLPAAQAFAIEARARRDIDVELAARAAQLRAGAGRDADVHVLQ